MQPHKEFKTAMLIISIVVIVLAVIGVYGVYHAHTSTIKIGLITPLSGELANYGAGTRNAAQLALREINAEGTTTFELAIQDSPCNPHTALSAINNLIAVDHVKMILGPMCSSELLAIAPLVNEEQIVATSSSATMPDITYAGDYVFRVVVSDDLRAKLFATYIYTTKNITNIALIYENDDAGVGYKTAFMVQYQKLGGTIVAVESYEKGATDLRTILTKIETTHPDAIMMASYPAETGIILKQAKQLGITSQFFEGFEVMSDPQVAQIAGSAVNGVTYIQSANQHSLKTEEFTRKYKEAYGSEPPYYAAEAYDIVKLYGSIIRNEKDLGTVKEKLYAVNDFEGASGTITFDTNGDIRKPFEIGQVMNNTLTPLEIVS